MSIKLRNSHARIKTAFAFFLWKKKFEQIVSPFHSSLDLSADATKRVLVQSAPFKTKRKQKNGICHFMPCCHMRFLNRLPFLKLWFLWRMSSSIANSSLLLFENSRRKPCCILLFQHIWHLWFYSIEFYCFYHMAIQFPAVARLQGLSWHLEFVFFHLYFWDFDFS